MIHQYRNNGYNIVMDVNSGSVHVVDDCVYEVLPAVEQLFAQGNRDRQSILDAVLKGGYHFEKQELSEAVDEILELAEAGQLFTEDIYEKYIGDFKNRPDGGEGAVPACGTWTVTWPAATALRKKGNTTADGQS